MSHVDKDTEHVHQKLITITDLSKAVRVSHLTQLQCLLLPLNLINVNIGVLKGLRFSCFPWKQKLPGHWINLALCPTSLFIVSPGRLDCGLMGMICCKPFVLIIYFLGHEKPNTWLSSVQAAPHSTTPHLTDVTEVLTVIRSSWRDGCDNLLSLLCSA